MTIQTITRYRTSDGTVFHSAQAAADYEASNNIRKALLAFVEKHWPKAVIDPVKKTTGLGKTGLGSIELKYTPTEIFDKLHTNFDELKSITDIKA